jgi:hypothetical protein
LLTEGGGKSSEADEALAAAEDEEAHMFERDASAEEPTAG